MCTFIQIIIQNICKSLTSDVRSVRRLVVCNKSDFEVDPT